ncbi:pentapeptide repeat-containing protein [Actinomycetospora sp. TBRC 11914]|uniref:pentapeptide repeat-containing protein n=1 Tax=Actinomycetospora sp. TBRC 11914 TaxID=2729387 RepID=UPI00145F9CBE|nr:hypothetical protein [Actinomycetospora sp. TBRC 11914]
MGARGPLLLQARPAAGPAVRVGRGAPRAPGGADLLGADLLGADLLGADLLGADLLGADLLGLGPPAPPARSGRRGRASATDLVA